MMKAIRSLINMPLLMEQLKRFWLISLALMIFYLLLGILPVYIVNEHSWMSAETLMAQNLVAILSMDNAVPIMAILASPAAAVMALYPFHFSRNAASAFYSFPVTKRQLFWTNWLAGLVLMILPLVIFCLLLLIPIHYPEPMIRELGGGIQETFSAVRTHGALFPQGLAVGDTINTFPVVAGLFARMAVGMIFYFALFGLAVSLSGNRLVAVLLCGALPLIPVGGHLLMDLIGNMYVFGYTGVEARLATTAAITNPVGWSAAVHVGPGTSFPAHEPRIGLFFLAYILFTMAFITAGYIFSHARKLERTEDSVVFTGFKHVCVFLVSAFGMILTGAFMINVLRSSLSMYIGFVIGFIIAYIAAQMIAERTFFIAEKLKGLLPYGGVMIGMYLVMFIFTNFGMGFYVDRVPQTQEIAEISLDWSGFRRATALSDPQTIARTTEIHQSILDNRAYLRNLRWQVVSHDWRRNIHEIPISYRLHDGSVISRRYQVSMDFMIYSGLGDLMNSAPVILAQNPIFTRPEAIEDLGILIFDDFGHRHRSLPLLDVESITDRAEIASLMAAVAADHVAIVQDNWDRQVRGDEWTDWGYSIHINIWNFQEYFQDDPFRWPWMPSLDSNRAVNTMAWLEERGFDISTGQNF